MPASSEASTDSEPWEQESASTTRPSEAAKPRAAPARCQAALQKTTRCLDTGGLPSSQPWRILRAVAATPSGWSSGSKQSKKSLHYVAQYHSQTMFFPPTRAAHLLPNSGQIWSSSGQVGFRGNSIWPSIGLYLVKGEGLGVWLRVRGSGSDRFPKVAVPHDGGYPPGPFPPGSAIQMPQLCWSEFGLAICCLAPLAEGGAR